jgi:hypothetical protein
VIFFRQCPIINKLFFDEHAWWGHKRNRDGFDPWDRFQVKP